MKAILRTLLTVSLLAMALVVSAAEYHVSKIGSDCNNGAKESPFLTIQAAANVARAGDVVTVHEGTYRERVDPKNGGLNELNRIIYQAAEGEEVVIKGSELIKGWKRERGRVWRVVLPNSSFGDYNPYADSLFGDWLHIKEVQKLLTGEVFLNGKSLFQKDTLEHVHRSEPYEDALDKRASTYTWYAEVDSENTTIWANFQEFDPNKELVEISAREACFYPSRSGVNYITVRGFTMEQAATQWAAPTAEQPAIIGTHWSKGWIIEDNIVKNSKSVGISLGKDRATGHNEWSHNPMKDGATYYNEVILLAHKAGWSKEQIGSHIVRNNTISECGQAGIVGSLGAVFSEIYNNHIYDIWIKRIFDGFEQGGIKIHAPIDVLIKNNLIHNARAGIWLDWMAQGTRVTGNIVFDNTAEDINIEVSHGPFMIDNNILLSEMSLHDMSEGGAYVHNIFAGGIYAANTQTRSTPYHFPHSTDLKGVRYNSLGDNRFVNNIFIKPENAVDTLISGFKHLFHGLYKYNIAQYKSIAEGNIYYNGAKSYKEEATGLEVSDFNPYIKIEKREDGIYLILEIDDNIFKANTSLVTTQRLGSTIVSEASYVNPDGTPYIINTDFLGNSRGANPIVGPFENLKIGRNEFKVW